ncbi:hypothetical protein KFE25_000257 [Diacronema lutheri]|uniref:Mitochondrial import inner membrane translocase subunit TIM50 n=2 Tax=Diacronema lutheri TaxID=2081491 RepID=A0A8J5XP24_DIALT|nr:hypothetical protein KFE25_000257 [Diacronema lutheri]
MLTWRPAAMAALGEEGPQLRVGPRPRPAARRKLLILDLNGLLVDRVRADARDTHGAAAPCDLRDGGRDVYFRPHAREFVRFCLERFDVAIWTSAKLSSISRVLDAVLPAGARGELAFVWDQRHCTHAAELRHPESASKPIVVKDLARFWTYDADRARAARRAPHDAASTILVDDSVYKTAVNPPHTSVHPPTWLARGGERDAGLAPNGALRALLAALSDAAGDVRDALERAAADFPALVPGASARVAQIEQIPGLDAFCRAHAARARAQLAARPGAPAGDALDRRGVQHEPCTADYTPRSSGARPASGGDGSEEYVVVNKKQARRERKRARSERAVARCSPLAATAQATPKAHRVARMDRIEDTRGREDEKEATSSARQGALRR